MGDESRDMIVRQSFPILASTYKGLTMNEIRLFINFLGRIDAVKDQNQDNIEVDYTYKELREIIPGNKTKAYIEAILSNMTKTTCTFEVEENFLTKKGKETVIEKVRGKIETTLVSVFTEFDDEDDGKRVRIRLHEDIAPLVMDNSYFRYTLLSFNEFTSLPSKMAQSLYRLLLLNQYEARRAAPKMGGGIIKISLKKLYKYFGYDSNDFSNFFKYLKAASVEVNNTHLKHEIEKMYKTGTHTVNALKFIYLSDAVLQEKGECDNENE